MNKTALERFAEKYEILENGCFEWTGAKNIRGYGCFWSGEKSRPAHRWLWEEVVGPVKEGFELDHVECQNKACVNPDHLEEVTGSVNVKRAYASRTTPKTWTLNKTHCINGHEFTEENTYVNPKNRRVCRKCIREADRRRR